MSTLGVIIVIILVVALFGGHLGLNWGNGPSGLLGALLIIVLILVLTGHL